MKEVENSMKNKLIRKVKTLLRIAPKEGLPNSDETNKSDTDHSDEVIQECELSESTEEENKKDR